MNVFETPIAGALLIEPKVHGDHRGFFMEMHQATLRHVQGELLDDGHGERRRREEDVSRDLLDGQSVPSREDEEAELDPAGRPELSGVLDDHVFAATRIENGVGVVLRSIVEGPEAGIDDQDGALFGAGIGQPPEPGLRQERTSRVGGIALLLAILNAGLFIESAAVRMPALSQVGSVLSWAILALWWYRTAGVVGVLPGLAVVTGLTLITLGGHTWAHFSMRSLRDEATPDARSATALGLLGHAFLFFVALNPQWSLPPWPLFGSLAVATVSAMLGARIVRMHDVAESVDAMRMVEATLGWRTPVESRHNT